ncbi:MAG: TRAP transporter small permease [Elusimicrobia bacterium]|nr:TRAP transporter small permease [Elusimicrobiota bacterium]
MEAIRRVEAWLGMAERLLLTVIVTVVLTLSFYQVVMRALFSGGILWGDTLSRHLVVWIGFLGAGLAAGADKQFAMDASTRLFSGRLKAGVMLACHVFTTIVCAFLIKASLAFFRPELAEPKTLLTAAGVKVPAWALEIIIPAGFALLFAHYLLKTAQAGHALATGRELPGHAE